MLYDNQKQAIIDVIVAAKRVWNAGHVSEETAAARNLMGALTALDNAMSHPDIPAAVTPTPAAEPEAPEVAGDKPTEEQQAALQSDAPQHVAQMQVP